MKVPHEMICGLAAAAGPSGVSSGAPERGRGAGGARWLLVAALLGALCCSGAGEAAAQSITITPSPIEYPTPTVAHYDAAAGPLHRVTASTANLGSNGTSYEMWIRQPSGSIYGANSLGNGKSLGHLSVTAQCLTGSGGGCGTPIVLSTTSQKFHPGVTGNQTFNLDFQITSWSWSADTPFTYETSLTIEARTANNGSLLASQTVTFRVVVNPLLTMTTSSTLVSHPAPTVTNFDAGWVNASSTTAITTKCNTAHKLVIKAATTNFSSDNISAIIPASDQEWSTDVSGSWSAWTGLSTTNAIVVSRSAGNYSTPFNIRHRQLLGWSRTLTGKHTLKVDYAVQQ